MAKKKDSGLLPILAGVFCFFVTFLKVIGLLSSFSIYALLPPALWLLCGLLLMTKQKNWLTMIGFLPVVILVVQSGWGAIPFDSLQAFVGAMLCRVLPAVGFALLWVLFLLNCIPAAPKMRRNLWWLPIVLVLPGCIWQSASTLPWAQLGVVVCLSIWLKPGKK